MITPKHQDKLDKVNNAKANNNTQPKPKGDKIMISPEHQRDLDNVNKKKITKAKPYASDYR
jgi:hypothetical protein